ncbi:MAG TPA: Holliday junction branch migration protein RuvA [Ktedonobacterales bacterium]|nr:Holliday junction branch migration protein RuvA [Ktedonobacterales bacterium]
MIAAVRGTVEGKTLDSIFVAVGGVTLRVLAPITTVGHLETGQPAHLYTYLLVREDALTLYGFTSADERDTFEQLLGVGGVGPQMGLALIGALGAPGLREAVLTEDVDRLTTAPRVGKKLAARMVLELRPRFEKLGLTVPEGVGAGPASNARAQVVEALTGLGYTPAQAAAAVRSLPADAQGSVEDLIVRALRALGPE